MNKTSIIFILCIALAYGCVEKKQPENNKAPFDHLNLIKYPKSSLYEDFDLLIKSLKEAHTGLYWYNSEAQFDSVALAQRQTIKDSMNALQFYNIVSPVIAFTKEDHCDLYLSDTLSSYMKDKGKYMPLVVLSYNEKIYALNNPNHETKIAGQQITKINGEPIEQVYKKLFNTFGSDGNILQSKYRWLDNINLSKLYARSIAQPEKIEIEVKDEKSSEVKSYQINTVDKSKLLEINDQIGLYQDLQPAEFEVLDDATVLLTINTFNHVLYEENGMDFEQFIKQSFDKIDSLDAQNLIIDIRENGGGTEGNEDYLFSFLTARPYNKYKDVEISAFTYSFYPYTDYSLEEDYLDLENEIKKDHYLAADGRILRKEGVESVTPLQSNPFTGNVYVLISGWTYSGGAEFASLMKQHTSATFLGEEMGGGFYGNTSGYSFTLTLPHTELGVEIPLLKFSLDVDKGIFGRGVIPDYNIQKSYSDFKNGHDPVLKFAKELSKN